MLLSLVVGLACFFGGLYYLHSKLKISQEDIYILLAGSSFFNALTGVSQIILGLIAMNSGLMLLGLASAVLSGFFAHIFAKRGNLID